MATAEPPVNQLVNAEQLVKKGHKNLFQHQLMFKNNSGKKTPITNNKHSYYQNVQEKV